MMGKCPICLGSSVSVMHSSNVLKLLKCGDCGLVMKDMEFLGREDVQNLQDNVYVSVETSFAQDKMIRARARDRLRMLKEYRGSGRLLEIGCSCGEFLESAQGAGFETFGIDASALRAARAREKGLSVLHGRLEDADYSEKCFDIIALFHVLEHIEEPVAFLLDVSRYLKPGGILFVIVPNLESTTNRIFGYSLPGILQPDHLLFFSRHTLGRLLEKTGFEIAMMTSREYVTYMFATLMTVMRNHNRLKKLKEGLTGRGNEAFRVEGDREGGHLGAGAFFKSLMHYLSGILLYPLMRPYGKLVEVKNRGQELVFIAVKPRTEASL